MYILYLSYKLLGAINLFVYKIYNRHQLYFCVAIHLYIGNATYFVAYINKFSLVTLLIY